MNRSEIRICFNLPAALATRFRRHCSSKGLTESEAIRLLIAKTVLKGNKADDVESDSNPLLLQRKCKYHEAIQAGKR